MPRPPSIDRHLRNLERFFTDGVEDERSTWQFGDGRHFHAMRAGRIAIGLPGLAARRRAGPRLWLLLVISHHLCFNTLMEFTGVRYRVVPHPRDHFDKSVSPLIQQGLYAAVVNAYEHAYDHTSGRYDPKKASTTCGQVRHAECETNLLGLAGRFPEVSAGFVPNANGTHHHAELRCRGVLLTISSTRSPLELPARAHYRTRLYASNAQHLFDTPEENDDPLYCVLAHGAYGSRYTRTPDFVVVLFPHPNGIDIVGSVDLHTRYRQEAADAYHMGAKEGTHEEQLVRTKGKSA